MYTTQRKVAVEKRAYDGNLLTGGRRHEGLRVVGWTSRLHEKPDKPTSIAVTYYCANGAKYTEWICPMHGGYPLSKAMPRAHDLGAELTEDDDIDTWLAEIQACKGPDRISVEADGKWWRVTEVL